MEEVRELDALVMSKDSTEISVNKDGFGFKTDGEASERLANAALDFLSPITEGAGFLGTKLRGYRMEAALKATIRAKQICEENKLSINPVPPKFLLQWVEGASMENIENDNNLSDLWAGLLASTSSGDLKNNILFVDALKKLDRVHIDLFEFLIRNDRARFYNDTPFELAPHRLKQSIIRACRENKAFGSKMSDEVVLQIQRDSLEQLRDTSGAAIMFEGYYFYQDKQRQVMPCYDDFSFESDFTKSEFKEDVIDGLVALNLLESVWIEDFAPCSPHCEMAICYAYLTDFGAALLDACKVQTGKYK